ncbi:MAG: hypothetical protein H6816_07065 [Phycisphaerales bacterium]|nr:hypothetical protein [Phycisphaerales bacterium]
MTFDQRADVMDFKTALGRVRGTLLFKHPDQWLRLPQEPEVPRSRADGETSKRLSLDRIYVAGRLPRGHLDDQ